jgi:hypothetical protein
MTNPIDSPAQGHPRNPPVRGPVHMEAELVIAALTGEKEKMAWGSAQPLEKAHFRQENGNYNFDVEDLMW